MLPDFELIRATTVEGALEAMGRGATAYCGGTELFIAMRAGLLRPERLVDLKRVAALRGIEHHDGHLVIGSAVTHLDLSTAPAAYDVAPMLVEVERHVGNPRVRSVGTIGGNLCFAEPKSDVTTALVALEASVVLSSSGGDREVLVHDFLLGPYWTAREEPELMKAIRIPIDPRRRAVYEKFQIGERPTVGIAIVVDGSTGAGRVVAGAVGERPVVIDFARLSDVAPEAVSGAVDPIADLDGSVEYKRHVTGVYVGRAKHALEALP